MKLLHPIQRRQYGIAMIGLACIFGAASAGAGVYTKIRKDAVVDQIAAADEECQGKLRTLGANNVQSTGTEVIATWPDLEGGYAGLGSASAAAMSCPGWTMKAFCMGQTCATPGISLTLAKVQPGG